MDGFFSTYMAQIVGWLFILVSFIITSTLGLHFIYLWWCRGRVKRLRAYAEVCHAETAKAQAELDKLLVQAGLAVAAQ